MLVVDVFSLVDSFLQLLFSEKKTLNVIVIKKKKINNYFSWSLLLSTIEMASKCCSKNTRLCCIIRIVTLCYPLLPCITPCYPIVPCVTLRYPV